MNPTVIAYVSADLTCAFVSNLIVPKLTSEGVGVEFSWVPTTADKLDLSVEYLKATETTPDISTYTAAQLLGIATTQNGTLSAANPATASAALATALASAASGYDGLTLQSSPKYSGNLSYQHELRLPNGASLTPRVNMVYKSRSWTGRIRAASTPSPAPPPGRTSRMAGSPINGAAVSLRRLPAPRARCVWHRDRWKNSSHSGKS